MFLSGTQVNTIDAKGRLVLPAKFRLHLGPEVVITPGFERCLMVFTLEKWEELASKIDELPISNRKVRFLRRMILSGERVRPDKMGRILIPPHLREFAGLNRKVIIVGQGRWLELWDPERWESDVIGWVKERSDEFAQFVEDTGI